VPGRTGPRQWEARWTDTDGHAHSGRHPTAAQAVQHVARHQAGGLRFHDLRQNYATWLVDDGVPPNMVQRVPGHERSTTTLDLYTHRTDNSSRILDAPSTTRTRPPRTRTRTTARNPSVLRSERSSGNAPATGPIMNEGLAGFPSRSL
jgi:hypothetical protein